MKSTRLLAWPLFALLSLTGADAHPMGNISVNHYSRITVGPEQVEIVYALDLAEIPTFKLLQGWNLTAASPRKSLEQKAAQQMREWARKLAVQSHGKTVHPVYESSELAVSDGAGNMPVMRITAKLRVHGVAGKLDYEDGNYPDRAGWKEVVVASGKGATLGKSSAGTEDRSHGLKVYPQDATVSSPQVLKASVQWTSEALPVVATKVKPTEVAKLTPVAAAVPAAPQASGTVVREDFLSELLSRKEISFSMILIGLAVAFGLGAVHAFSPGHGKTMVAAYLVGSRGSFKHAAFLGAMVTFTHTISVFALGFVTLFLSRYILPEQLYPVLGAISGITIAWIGGTLFFRRIRKLRPQHHHHHDHDHSHSHDHDHAHDHGPNGHTHVPEGDVTMGSLIALGASGGLVPCPSGLVILLSSIAIGRVGLGILLLVGFSAGLAAVLTAIGLLVVYAKSWLPDAEAAAASPAFRYIPVASAAVVVVLGILMTGVSLGFIQPGRFIG